jgi:CxxC motif-containing protein
MVCINCPKGCVLEAVRGADGKVSVTGHTCPRGEKYAIDEMTDPRRMVTGLVRVAGMRKPLPVKTRTAVPKAKIAEVLFALSQTTVQLPVAIGDVVVKDICGLGVDVVATNND